MNVSPNVNLERIEEADLKLQFQLNKCLNERWRRTQGYLEDLAGYISASDMCSLSANPDKCAILQETVNQIRQIKLAEDCPSGDDLQKSEVSSSNPTYLGSDLIAPFLLHALDGFLFVVNTDGKIEFISQNVESFLKYHHESLIDNSIYNIIHVGDHARFSSNLLPMSIGNGFGWSEPSKSCSQSSAFSCRFLIKPPEDQEETMEEKQTRVSHYEQMHVSAVLLPTSERLEPTEENQAEVQNRLVCVARRMPSGEKNSVAPGAEQFLTRLDARGKIISVDTTNLSAANLQYLNKDLVGCILQEICHPEDFQKLTQHLKDTLQQGSNTSGIYRLRFSNEKIIFVQTKSKRANYNPMASEHEVIVASHTIIRDSDHCLESSVAQRSNPTPAGASLVPSLGATMNGGSAYSFPSSLSPQDFNLNDIGLDFLPSSSWDLGGGADSLELASSAQPQRTQQQPGSNTYSPELISGGHTGSPSTRSQASGAGGSPGRATPFSNSFPFSPASGTSSPAPGLVVKREDQLVPPPSNGGPDPQQQLGGDGATQKLRNLLTHGAEEADSSKEKMEVVENGFSSNGGGGEHSNENLILRELLNQEDEEVGAEGMVKGLDANCNLALGSDMCGDSLQKRTLNNNNNMLRKLLNNDEEKSFKRNQDQLIQQLLKTEGKVSVDMNNLPISKSGGPSRLANSVMDNVTMNNVAKRKSPDTPMDESLAKRPAPQQNQPHAHLAGQNPMLASMLAQTPRTAPTVPTSIANAIVSQLPQARLPKNLEKKLVHTPYTGAPPPGGTGAPGGQYSFAPMGGGSRGMLQQEVVTADSRGHVTLAPQQNTFNQVTSFMNRMLSPGESNQLGGGAYGGSGEGSQASLQSTANLLIDGLAEASRDPNNVVSASDPLLSDILDQVWSMEQDMHMATDDFAFFKLLEELPDPQRPPSAPQQDAQEKLAIQSIQKQLMSCEPPPPPSRNPRPSYPQGGGQFQQPPAYTRAPASQQQQMAQQMGNQRPQALPQYGSGVNNFNDLTPPMRRQLLEQHKHKVFLQQQFNQKKLLLQQKQQQLNRDAQLPGLQSPGPFDDNMNDLINNSVAPNVTLQRSASMPEPQLSPRYAQQQPPASPSQLSPGQRGGPFSPMQQGGAYPPGGPYPQQARLSPHVGQPQQGVWAQQQRASQQQQANLQQQNPMLNAQLSQQQFANSGGQARFSSGGGQQQQPVPQRQMLHSPRNSPYPPDFHPPSSPGLFQQQQRLQRAVSIPNRVNSPRGLAAGFAGDPLLSPQPSPGNYGSPPVSSYGAPNTSYGGMDFPYDQQVYPASMGDRSRGNGGGAIRSEYVRQELRAKVGARTQQHQMHQQQLVQQQQQMQSPNTSGSQSASQSISQADFDALGFSLDLGNDVQPTSPALYSQSLLNSVGGVNSNDPQPRTGSPRFQLEERPAEQKKSLLQQLLSEPP